MVADGFYPIVRKHVRKELYYPEVFEVQDGKRSKVATGPAVETREKAAFIARELQIQFRRAARMERIASHGNR